MQNHSLCLAKLQITRSRIKNNSKILGIDQTNNLVHLVKFCQNP